MWKGKEASKIRVRVPCVAISNGKILRVMRDETVAIIVCSSLRSSAIHFYDQRVSNAILFTMKRSAFCQSALYDPFFHFRRRLKSFTMMKQIEDCIKGLGCQLV